MPDDPTRLHGAPVTPLSRRAFLGGSTLLLGATAAGALARTTLGAAPSAVEEPALRVGLLTDLHHADKQPGGTRHYREALSKLREAVERFNRSQLDLVVELGDLIDQAKGVADEIAYLKVIDAEYARLERERHYVLGNHCVATLTKEEFCANSGAREPYYSFDAGGVHLVILDACFRKDHEPYGRNNFVWTDTNVAPEELAWLEKDLEGTAKPTLVFVHQRLDITGNHAVKNAPAVRKILEASGRVLAVFQGHNHLNDHREIGRIHYVTLQAMVEGSGPTNSGYSILEVFRDGSMRLDGFRRHEDRALAAHRRRMRV